MRNRNKSIVKVVLLFGLVLNTAAQNTLTLSIDEAETTIKKTIYGALLENWGRDIYDGLYVGRDSDIPNTLGMRNDIIEAMKECGLATLEFPGGCFADEYHWEDGIGPVDQRPGGESRNGMGTDEYMELCKLIDAEPYICANLNTGTPEEMAAWINYVNDNPSHPEWHVKYWGMGNEPWGCGGELSASEFADQYAEFVAAVPEIEGKPMLRIAGAGHWSTDWVTAVFDRNPGKLEGFSTHRYLVNDWTDMAGPSINYTDYQYHQIIDMAYGVTSVVQAFDGAMDQYDPENEVGLMYNEWGAWYQEISSQGYTFSQSTVRDALIAAIHLNAFNNYCERVHLACVAQPVNVIQSLFLTDINDQTEMVKTPVFYAFKLFKPHQNAKKIPIDLQSETFNQNVEGTNFSYPYLTASASIDSTENVNITISNSDLSNSKDLTIQLDGTIPYSSVTGKVITAPEVTAYNDFNQAENVNIQSLSDDKYSLDGSSLTVQVPSKSVIGLKLTPSTKVAGGALSGTPKDREYNVRTTEKGLIVIDFKKEPLVPVSLKLFGVDGRIIAENRISSDGNKGRALQWQLQGINTSNGIYILRIETNNVSVKQKVVFTN